MKQDLFKLQIFNGTKAHGWNATRFIAVVYKSKQNCKWFAHVNELCLLNENKENMDKKNRSNQVTNGV